jgi:hypothetical protein
MVRGARFELTFRRRNLRVLTARRSPLRTKKNAPSACKRVGVLAGGRAKGGVARAAALTPERRKEIAKMAVEARWNKNIPKATHGLHPVWLTPA